MYLKYRMRRSAENGKLPRMKHFKDILGSSVRIEAILGRNFLNATHLYLLTPQRLYIPKMSLIWQMDPKIIALEYLGLIIAPVL